MKQAHTVYQTQYHIVWVTRYRRKILCQGIDTYLKILVTKEFNECFPDIYVEEVGIDKDHIHIHCIIPPKYAVSKIVEAWKSNTSRLLKEKFPEFLSRVYWDGEGIWGTECFVSTIGLNEKIIKAYVAQQGKHDAGRDSEAVRMTKHHACEGVVLHIWRLIVRCI